MIRSLAIVLRGTVIAQLIGFMVLPLLTRLYTPTAFGSFQLYMSILTILLVFATLRFEVAVLRADGPRELTAVLLLCLGANLMMALAMAACLGVAIALGWPSIMTRLPFSPPLLIAAFLIAGTVQYLGFLVTREQLYAVGANGKIAQSSVYAATSTGTGLVSPIMSGIILADMAGRLASLCWLGRWFLRTRSTLLGPATAADVRAAFTKFREFPLISVPGALVNTIGSMLTPIMIYATFSPATSGQFALVERSLTLPVGLVVTTVAQVYTAQFAAALRNDVDAAHHQFRSLIGWMASLAAIPTLIAFVLIEPAFRLVFGAGWSEAGRFAQIMIPSYYLMLISGPINMTLVLLGKQATQMGWEVGRLVLMCALWLSVPWLAWPIGWIVIAHAAIIGLSNIAFLALADAQLKRRVATSIPLAGVLPPDTPSEVIIR